MYHVKLYKSLKSNTFYRQPIMIVQFALTLTYVNCKPNLQRKDFTTEDFKSLEKKGKNFFCRKEQKVFFVGSKKKKRGKIQ